MKKIFLICFIVMLLLQGCGESHLPADPDVVSSISMGRDQYLTVVANCDEIEDKEEFAWKLFKCVGKIHSVQSSFPRIEVMLPVSS